MKTKYLIWNKTSLLFRMNSDGTYSPCKSTEDNDSLYNECKNNQYLRYSEDYLINYCDCLIYNK